MLGTLTDMQMNNLLASQVRGRIACTNGKRSFILPFTYIFDGGYLYGELHDKRKMEVLRKNPGVCFEIDLMQGLTNWQEVIIEGKIEQLSGDEENKVRDFLSEHIYPFAFDTNPYKRKTKPATGILNKRTNKSIFCRIKIEKKSGCFEREFV
jgi:nitroimidazol reductase NimA-like FMN-containing flavoprotein (pyridoxamine 5'-phosphate oxidase superfamily)